MVFDRLSDLPRPNLCFMLDLKLARVKVMFCLAAASV